MQTSRFLISILAFCAIAVAQTGTLPAVAPIAENQGFCPNGVYPGTTWPKHKPNGLNTWGSYCAKGDQTTGEITTAPFTAASSLSLYLAGYPSGPEADLEIENISTGSKLRINPPETPGARWILCNFPLPVAWRGEPARLICKDQSTGSRGWLAFSEPVKAGAELGFKEAAMLLLRTIAHFVLTILPCLAVCALVIRKGVRDVAVAGLVALAATGASGYLVFWLWLLWPRLGHLVAFLLPIAGALTFWWAIRKIDPAGRAVLKALIPPTLLTAFASLLVISMGFLYGGLRDPLTTAGLRFSHPLLGDNAIPYVFAEGVRIGHVPKPLLEDWRSSDRPPLQTGIVLSQYPYNPAPRVLGYEVLSVIAQSFWIFALWLLLTALDLDRRAIALALAVCLFSGFVFINSFFVWPKLLAAAFMIGLVAILLTERLRSALGHSAVLSVTAGALLAFGALSHGGSAFALIGVALVMLVLKLRISFGGLAAVIVTAFLLYLPWMFYQKFYDPPGNRLLKYQLAGVENVDKRSFVRALIDSYGSLSFRQIADDKLSNFEMPIGHVHEYWSSALDLLTRLDTRDPKSAAQVDRDAGGMRALMFFFVVPALGFLAAGPAALLIGIGKRYRTKEWRTAVILWLFIVVTIIPWCLLLFGPTATAIHQGTYVTILLALTGSMLAFWAVSRWLAWLVGGLEIALNFLIYVVLMRPSSPVGILPEGVLRYWTLALALLSVFGIVSILARPPRANRI